MKKFQVTKEMQDILNGLEILYHLKDVGRYIPCVILAQKGKSQISFKPLVKPETLAKYIHWRTIRELKAPSFCLGSVYGMNSAQIVCDFIANHIKERKIKLSISKLFSNYDNKPVCTY